MQMQDSALSSIMNNESCCSSFRAGLDGKNKIKKLSLKKKNLNDDSKVINELADTNPYLLYLNLSSNNLTEVPISILPLSSLITLDMRKNPLKDINQVIDTLANFKYLTDLKIDFSNSSQVQTTLNKIPYLLRINGKSTEDYITLIDINKEVLDKIDINNLSTKEFNDLFMAFENNLQNANQEELAKEIHEKFQNLINDEGTKINSSNNSNNNLPNYILANNIIKSEKNLISFFINLFFNHSEYLTMENSKKDISQKINDIINLLFDTLANIIDELKTKIDEVNKIQNKKIELLLDYLNENNTNNNFSVENTIKKGNNITDEIEKLQKKYIEEIDLYKIKIQKLQKENKLVSDLLIKKGIELSINNFNINNLVSSNNNKKSEGGAGALVGMTGARILTKKQMLDFIDEIYASKIEYDKVCADNHLKKESMEHYMYKFLNNKYGLKNIVVEWSSSVITAIKMYSSKDCDINLFGKILKNKIEEGQRLVILKLKSTIRELYDIYIKNKSRINKNQLIQRETDDFLLNEDEWKNILKSIYNEDEYNIINKYILNKISDKNEIQKKNYINNLMSKKKSEVTRNDLELANKKIFPKKINFKEFENILIEYQIIYREKYLSNLHKLFIYCDEENLGYLKENGFNKMLNSIPFIKNQGNEYMKKLLNKIDPHSYNSITFSDIVYLFSEEIITDENGLNMNILDKLGLEDSSNFNYD